MFARNPTVATAVALFTAVVAGTALAHETYVIDRCIRSRCSRCSIWAILTAARRLLQGYGQDHARSIREERRDRRHHRRDVGEDHRSKLDTHIRSEDFFNVAKYPSMTFKSSELSFDGDRVVGADGELTMLGITKPVKLKVANFVCGDHPFTKKALCGAEVTTTIKRSDWGMKYGIPKALGDDVKIMIPVEAYKE